ncbi:coenzyme F420-0:L-glutamate ligase/coenzyme F420-1:gamma-L-glutamate ligase [Nitrobacteraceae bacterium AZCC 2161]|jgi:coenzyme F420-0:L-glutamate ligase/coenzyme F420-1:gamma-L-glutamate ligase
MTRSITYTTLPNIPLVQPGDDICALISAGLARAEIAIQDGDVIVIAQKIVSKSEDRYVDLAQLVPSAQAKELAAVTGKDARHIEAVLAETSEVLRFKQNVMIVAHRLGYVMANAGIDESNIERVDGVDRVLLLPVDPDKSCRAIKAKLDREFAVSVGVIINDSFGRAWRNGVVGVALGAAGISSLHNLIGSPDLFGRAMKVTEVAIGDELAAAASLVMGQGAEGLPIVHVRGYQNRGPENDAAALIRPKHMDMFR